MKKGQKKPILLVLLIISLMVILILIGIIIYKYSSNINCTTTQNSTTNYLYKVTDIIDGDTIVLERGNYIRIIGINAPEKNQPYYEEAKDHLTKLLLNKSVRIEKDIDNSDNYGRLLRYIYLEINGKDISVGTLMIEQGLAIPMTVEPNTKYKAEIDIARRTCLITEINLCKK